MKNRFLKTCFALLITMIFFVTAAAPEVLTVYADETVEAGSDLPAVYDPRPDGVSPIRDQYWGTCWAQAGIAAAEVFLIHNGLENSSYQLSVEDVLWRTRDEGVAGWILPNREMSGYPPTMTGYLTTFGVRLESDIPYFGEPSDGDKEGSDVYGTGENQKPAAFDTAPVQYEITDMIYFKNANIEQAKRLILQYGAIGASYMARTESFNEETSAAWEPYTGEGSNHAIAVVGWDDNFPKENFIEQNGRRPQIDGAWIVKNSYGTTYGSDGGYIYISYEDGYLFNEEGNLYYCYVVTGARKPGGLKRYMHDQYGAIQTVEKNEEGTSVWANVFDFGTDEKISELSFVSWAAGSSYKLYYAPMDGEVPSADQASWQLLAEGTIDYPGYKTVASGWDEPVPAGKGAILLEVTGSTQSVGSDEPGFSDSNRLKFNPLSDKGTAFELKDGSFAALEVERTVNDYTYTEYPDLSIRAYTVQMEHTTHAFGPDGYCIECGAFIFEDVPMDASWFKYVQWAYENGLVNGTGERSFSPKAPCTRAQFAVMLYRMAGKPKVSKKKIAACPFTDMPEKSGIKKAITWAWREGIVTGTSDTTFTPNGNITRAQIAVMLYRLAGKPSVKRLKNPFTDISGLSRGVQNAITWAYNKKITMGTGDRTTFSPTQNATRSQIVTFLYKYRRVKK